MELNKPILKIEYNNSVILVKGEMTTKEVKAALGSDGGLGYGEIGLKLGLEPKALTYDDFIWPSDLS